MRDELQTCLTKSNYLLEYIQDEYTQDEYIQEEYT